MVTRPKIDNSDEAAKAKTIRSWIYAFDVVLILVYLIFGADVDIDTYFTVYIVSTIIAGYFLVVIRENPGVVSREINSAITETVLADELNQNSDTQFNLPSTVKMRELKSNLLEPELRASSTLGNWKNPQSEDSQELEEIPSNEKCSSDETHRDLEYSNFTFSQPLIRPLNEREEPTCQTEERMVRAKPAHFFCERCNNVQNYRTKHCKLCRVCIAKFDHHCYYTGIVY